MRGLESLLPCTSLTLTSLNVTLFTTHAQGGEDFEGQADPLHIELRL